MLVEMIGKTLQNGKYKIVRVLGHGGFGITYEGVQVGLNRRVAIKEFFMEDYCEREEGTSQVTIVGTKGNRQKAERFREKFIKEAQLIAGLEDIPHIIRIYDVFEENGTAYYVMQFIEGGSLQHLVKQRGRLDEATAVHYISQVADALSSLHERHIMHFDVKPDNILLKDGEAILIDFGISKHYDEEGNATTTIPVGISKGYAPLEQYNQGGVIEFAPEIDIYSLGATLFFLIVGERPPEANELISNPINCPSFISDSLKNAISMALQPSKDKRPHSISEFLNIIGTPSTYSHVALKKVEEVKLSVDKETTNKDATIYDSNVASSILEKSYIDVLTNTKGASVTIDGEWAGTAPNKFEVMPGEHQVIVSNGTEWSTFEKNVVVEKGKTIQVYAQLTRTVDADFNKLCNSNRDKSSPLKPMKIMGRGDWIKPLVILLFIVSFFVLCFYIFRTCREDNSEYYGVVNKDSVVEVVDSMAEDSIAHNHTAESGENMTSPVTKPSKRPDGKGKPSVWTEAAEDQLKGEKPGKAKSLEEQELEWASEKRKPEEEKKQLENRKKLVEDGVINSSPKFGLE